MNNNFKIISVNEYNLESEDVVCGRTLLQGSNLKKEWLMDRFQDGLKMKVLKIREQSWGIIEYMPAEYAWRPIKADGYMLINCFRIIGQYKRKGFGTMLLKECIEDSKDRKGIIIIVFGNRMLGMKAFLKYHGFEICDKILADKKSEEIDLWVLPFKKAMLPKFESDKNDYSILLKNGFTFLCTDQCPYIHSHLSDLVDAAKLYDMPVKVCKFKSAKEARKAPTPLPLINLSVFYNGKILSHGIRKKFFGRFLDKNNNQRQ